MARTLRRIALASILAPFFLACSSSDDRSSDAESATPSDQEGECLESPCAPVRAADGSLELRLGTGEFSVPPGEDFFQCFHTAYVTDSELAVIGARGTQGPGGHHITVYYTQNLQEAHSQPCDDTEMIEWNQIGAAGSSEFDLDFPDGLGVRIPADVQVVIQSHYINTTSEAITVSDHAAIKLANPEDLDAYMNDYVVLNTAFSVPPLQKAESVTTCRTPQDVDIVRLLGHEHEWGKYFKLEEIDESGATKRILLETDWVPEYTSNPPMQRYERDEPLKLVAGTRLRQTCRWENDQDYALEFPREMCLTYALYFPDAGGRVFCAPE